MVTIQTGNSVATLINLFTVEPENQQKLVDMLIEATEKIMKNMPGFISANIHKSTDGTRVTNYAQWRSKEDFAAMLKDPKAVEHMKSITDIAASDAHTYEVVESVSVT